MASRTLPDERSGRRPSPWTSPLWRDRRLRQIAGPALTVATVAGILVLRLFVPIPSPGLILLLAIAVAAVVGGIGPAMVSAAIAVLFAAVDASQPGQLFAYSPDQLSRLIVTIVVSPTMAALVGGIQQALERRTAQLVVQRSEERERALTDTATDAIVQIDVDSVIGSANPAAEAMFGYPAHVLRGASLTMLMPESFRDRHQSAVTRYAATGRRTIPWQGVELVGRHASGREFPVEVSFGEFDDDGTHRFTGIIRDISRRKELETKLLQAQKMDAIGQLAGGVAHDFNNMLTVISGWADLLAEELRSREDAEAIEGIARAAEQATSLTRQLLAFSRRQDLRPSVIDLNDTVRHMEPLLRRLIGADVRLVVRMNEGLWPVLTDPAQMQTVLVNLVVNGRDAVSNGGTVTIETANVDLDVAYAREHVAVEPGSYAMLAVSDTGIGMDAETMSHIFEPFFTTKPVGRGTGLGLATVYGIVRQSHGHITADSERGVGSTFRVYLPRADPHETTLPPPAPAAVPSHPIRGRTILVVEDQQAVRTLIVTVLRRHGYETLAAEDGAAAVRIIEDAAGQIDLLITDIVMPGLSGVEVAAVAERRRPGLPVLFISGYTAMALEPRGLGSRPLLEKPFTPGQLTEAVGELLGTATGDPPPA